jgi:hypothetical protein
VTVHQDLLKKISQRRRQLVRHQTATGYAHRHRPELHSAPVPPCINHNPNSHELRCFRFHQLSVPLECRNFTGMVQEFHSKKHSIREIILCSKGGRTMVKKKENIYIYTRQFRYKISIVYGSHEVLSQKDRTEGKSTYVQILSSLQKSLLSLIDFHGFPPSKV